MASCLAGVAGVGASRHDHFLQLTNRVLWLAGEGHAGASSVLAQARAAFMHATAGDRATGEAEREWDRMIVGGIAISVAKHHTIPEADPCLDPFAGLVPREMTKETPYPSPAPSATEPDTSPSTPAVPTSSTATTATEPASPAPTTGPTATDEPARTPEQQVVSSRLQAGGAFILDIPDKVPSIWGEGESVLWADGEALTICGPAGVGKTTLTGQVIRARLVGGDVLDLPVTPTSSKVLYLAMDRPRQIARALRRRRIERMRRARLGVESREDDELSIVPPRLRRPGAVVLEIDDEDPAFDVLDTHREDLDTDPGHHDQRRHHREPLRRAVG